MEKDKINKGPENKILKSIIWIAIFISLLVPLIYAVNALFPFASSRAFFFMAMAQIMFFAWLVLAIGDKKYRPKMNPVAGVLLAFFLAITLSTIFGADPFISFWSNYERMSGLLMYIHLFVFFLVLSSFLKGERDWLRVISFVAPIATFVALISLADNFEIISLPGYHQNASTLGNTSFMGSYLMVVVFFCLYALLKSEGFMRIFYGFNFATISAGILLNPGGRAMKGGFIVGMILCLLLSLAFAERKKFLFLIARFILIIGTVVVFFIGISFFTDGSIVRERVEGWRGMPARFLVWEIAWQGFQERPMLGWGLENFSLVFEKEFNPKLIIPEYGGEVWFDRAHNIVFDNLVQVGIIGTLLFFGIFVATIFILWKEFLNKKINIWAPAVFTSLIVAYFIKNLTVFDMISSYMLIFLLFAFAASFTIEREPAEKLESPRLISILAIGVLALTLNFFVFLPYGSNLNASLALNSPIGVENSMEYYKKGIQGPIGKNDTVMALAEVIIANMARHNLEENDREVVVEKIRFLKEELNNIIKKPQSGFREHWMAGRIHNDYYNYHILQQIIQGDFAKKENLLREAREIIISTRNILTTAREMSPRNQQVYWELAQTEINMGNIYILSGENSLAEERLKESFLLTEMAVELEPRSINAQIKMLRVANEIIMDQSLVEKKAREAIRINPLWEETIEELIGRDL